jgi:hemerythrin superfamily protein
MGSATEDRAEAARLPEGDVIRLLLEQHARIQDLFDEVQGAGGEERQRKFDELRTLLAVHETAEEIVLRPVSMDVAGKDVTDARNHEEAEANKILAALEKMDVNDPAFGAQLAAFKESVLQHAEAEEREEFPQVLAECDEKQRQDMGTQLKVTEKIAPTHPHPTAAGKPLVQMAAGPFASIVDRVRDALTKV